MFGTLDPSQEYQVILPLGLPGIAILVLTLPVLGRRSLGYASLRASGQKTKLDISQTNLGIVCLALLTREC